MTIAMPPSQIGLYDSNLKKIISGNPGINYNGIRKIANLSNGSLQRNLKRLEKSNSVKVYRETRKTRYFEKTFSEKYVDQTILLRRTTPKNIINMLLEHDKLFFKEIVQKSKLSPATVSCALTDLQMNGFIERHPESKNTTSYNLKNRQQIEKLIHFLKT